MSEKIELGINPSEGDIKVDLDSPSGYSIYKFRQWIPLVLQSAKKKKKKKHSNDDDYNQRTELEEKERIEAEEALIMAKNERIRNHITNNNYISVIDISDHYAIIIVKQKLNIHVNIEQGAGFQPYENTSFTPFHVVYLIQWAIPKRKYNLYDRLVNQGIRTIFISSIEDFDKFLEEKRAK